MAKQTFIVTDSIHHGGETLQAGDTLEVDGENNIEKMKALGHLIEGSKEADAFLAKHGKRAASRAAKKGEAVPVKDVDGSKLVPNKGDKKKDEKSDKKKDKKDKGAGDLA